MPKPLKIIILGGYGNFGARIAQRLSKHPYIELVIAGRNYEKAQTLASQLSNASATQLNIHASDISSSLRELGADVVIHTAGPFQSQDYSIALASAEAGAHYIDLADGRQFVCEFVQTLNDAFSKAGKLAITGASTLPAVSSAAVNALSVDMKEIKEIDICIAPAQSAPRGKATLQAVLGYCGEPIPIFRNGQWTHGYGWSDPSKINFARMRSRIGALCDVPDLTLFPTYYAGVHTVMFRAALEVELTQRMFAVLAYLRRKRLLPSLDYFASLVQLSARPFDFLGSQLGGMVVRVEGLTFDGARLTREWHISAANNYGPEIPCMAAILLARKLANQEIAISGAYCCMGLLTLQEFESEFRVWGMKTDVLADRSYLK